MNAVEKSAWTELVVVVVAVVATVTALPYLGHLSASWFALLAFLPLGMFFFRKRGDQVIVDERDREIQQKATNIGVQAAWMGTFMALIAVSMAHGYAKEAVPTPYLNWIIWLQFAGCYGVRALFTIFSYRGQHSAA